MRIGFRCIKLWKRDNFVNIKIDGRVILKETDIKNGMRARGLDSYGSEDRQVSSYRESGNEPSFSIDCCEFLD